MTRAERVMGGRHEGGSSDSGLGAGAAAMQTGAPIVKSRRNLGRIWGLNGPKEDEDWSDGLQLI